MTEIIEIGLTLEIFSGVLGLILSAVFFKRYLRNLTFKKYLPIPKMAPLWAGFFSLFHGINNLTWFISDLPGVESLTLAIIGYVTYGLIPLFGIFFTTDILNYKKREINTASSILISIFVILTFAFSPVKVLIDDIGFWILSSASFYFYVPIMAMSFIPSILFILFTIKTRSKKGILLALGFLFPAIFESVIEANMLLPLFITNLFEASGLLLIYSGYSMK
jgi:hypothetical protein